MIDKKDVGLVYQLNWEKYTKLTDKEIETITDNINKNLFEHINDEIKFYLECRE
jgi:hypothetical protein